MTDQSDIASFKGILSCK